MKRSWLGRFRSSAPVGLVALFSLIGACTIGPKPEDPGDPDSGVELDASTVDTGTGGGADTGTGLFDATPATDAADKSDAPDGGDADASDGGDAASDGATDATDGSADTPVEGG